MKMIVDRKLNQDEIEEIRWEFGDYVKVMVDVEKEIVIIGPELHCVRNIFGR